MLEGLLLAFAWQAVESQNEPSARGHVHEHVYVERARPGGRFAAKIRCAASEGEGEPPGQESPRNAEDAEGRGGRRDFGRRRNARAGTRRATRAAGRPIETVLRADPPQISASSASSAFLGLSLAGRCDRSDGTSDVPVHADADVPRGRVSARGRGTFAARARVEPARRARAVEASFAPGAPRRSSRS